MFESAELGHKVDKETYAREEPLLRADLLDAQYDVKAAARFPVIILLNGIDGAGKGETANQLNAWMDPRYIETRAFNDPTDEERERPHMWRFWRALPPRGKIGILFGNWYTVPVVEHVGGGMKKGEFERRLEEIRRFEKMLTDEGALLLKFWFHLSKAAQAKRIARLDKDPESRWRVTEADRWRLKHYEDYRPVCERALRETSTGPAPWTVVDGSDDRYRALTVGNELLTAIKRRLAWPADTTRRISEPPLMHAIDGRDLINSLDLKAALPKDKYEEQLDRWQGRLNQLTRHPKFANRSLIAVFEGNDAAGKGGTIRRVTSALDARQYEIVPVSAPTEDERAQPYMWRFWRRLPRHGRVAIFDRSWYGRVLVERVEGYCGEADWMRAYSEINEFEEQIIHHGAVVAKFWLAISPDEQLKRFKERETTRFKRFKITEDDWRNREKWDQYEAAVCDMIDRTSSELAPWTLVPANDKNHARIQVLKTLCERLEAALGLGGGRSKGNRKGKR